MPRICTLQTDVAHTPWGIVSEPLVVAQFGQQLFLGGTSDRETNKRAMYYNRPRTLGRSRTGDSARQGRASIRPVRHAVGLPLSGLAAEVPECGCGHLRPSRPANDLPGFRLVVAPRRLAFRGGGLGRCGEDMCALPREPCRPLKALTGAHTVSAAPGIDG